MRGHDRLVDTAKGEPRTMAVMAIVGVASFAGSLISEGAQHTQNRDSIALHAKLDELLRADRQARDAFIGIEERAVGRSSAPRRVSRNGLLGAQG